MDKYNINFTNRVKEEDKRRLVNQLWKLVPMRENEEDWTTQLRSVTEEIAGLVRLYQDKTAGLILLSKLEGLDSESCEDFMVYRKTVFKCIGLLSEVFCDE